MTATGTIILYGFAILAGAMDALVGAGGLIQIPALLILIPDAEAAAILGTHKFASALGTAGAVYHYHRAHRLTWRRPALTAALPAMLGAALGARTVTLIPGDYLRPVLFAFLVAAAVYIMRKKDDLGESEPRRDGPPAPWLAAGVGLALGFYDGAIGLGAGTLFLLAFVKVWRMDFLSAAAAARMVNFVTNLSSAAAFAYSGNILYTIALPLALLNLMGAVAGARLATTRGSRFVRTALLLTVAVLIVMLALQMLNQARALYP